MNPQAEEIPHGSDDYRSVLAFRDEILRRPLGLSLSPSDTAGEESQRHFILRDADSILAGVIAVRTGQREFRLRQMWVRSDMAGKGWGRQLIQAVEALLIDEDCETVTLHARLVVRGFYERCGYCAEGDIFDEIGIPHIHMKRKLGP